MTLDGFDWLDECEITGFINGVWDMIPRLASFLLYKKMGIGPTTVTPIHMVARPKALS